MACRNKAPSRSSGSERNQSTAGSSAYFFRFAGAKWTPTDPKPFGGAAPAARDSLVDGEAGRVAAARRKLPLLLGFCLIPLPRGVQ